MCGIAGVIRRDGQAPDPAVLDALERALAHRGPDGAGRWVQGGIGLVHTRLSIIDLETGDQPLFGPDDTVLVANGEIYNHRALRARYADHRYQTKSDCEPILHAYAAEGLGFVGQLSGMVALALADPARGRVVLHRDRVGIKPLYLLEAAWGVAFASEPAALVAAGLAAHKITEGIVDELLALQFITGMATPFPAIRRLAPGEAVVIEQGVIEGSRRLDALIRKQVRLRGAPLEVFDRVFETAVDVHQQADVPFGMFLSGGLDSTALLTMMARLAKTLGRTEPLLAYTARFPNSTAPDESDAARAAAQWAGAQHVDVAVTAEDLWTHLPAVAACMDDPALDYAILPTWLLARRARQDVKVILSGEGGDEVFAGYGRYRKAAASWPFRKPMRRQGALHGLGLLREETRTWRNGIAAVEQDVADAPWTALQKVQAVDIADWLPHDLLAKLDRCLMAHGVEGRVPFLDPEVLWFGFALPDRWKVRGRMGKILLRYWLAQHCPPAKPWARKQGFTVPVAAWIATKGDALAPLLEDSPALQPLCDPGAVAQLARAAPTEGRTSMALWRLLVYALWHAVHVQQVDRGGSVMDVLDQAGRA